MDNLFYKRKILIPHHCYKNDIPDIKLLESYLKKGYQELSLVNIEGKFAVCERR